MKRISLAIVLIAGFMTVPTFAEESAKKWKDSAEASYVNANGNSKATTTSAKNLFSYAFNTLTSTELEGGGLGARSKGVVTTEQYFARERLQHKVDDRDYVFQSYRWDRNRFAGIAHRHEFSTGVGRELWKMPKNLLTAEVAPGYINEERIGDKRRSFASARFYTKYVHDFTETAKFSQDYEYLQSLKDTRDNRTATETALTTALSTYFSVKTSFVWKHVSQPPPNAVKDDTLASFALIANF